MAQPPERGVWVSAPMKNGSVRVCVMPGRGDPVMSEQVPPDMIDKDMSKRLYRILNARDSIMKVTG